MEPAAPGRFSTTNGVRMESLNFCEITREKMSLAPPGGHGLTHLTARLGHSCARADAETTAKRTRKRPRPTGLLVADVDDLVAFDAAWRLDLDRFPGLLAY